MAAKNGKPDPVADAAALEAMEAFEQFADLGPGVEVEVARMPGGRYLELVSLDGLDCDLMRGRYGGGKFRLRARENGKFMKGISSRIVEIEGPPKVFPPPEVDPSASSEIAELKATLERLGSAPAQPTSDSLLVAMMGTLSTVLTTVLTASLERRESGPSALEILEFSRKMAKDARKDSGGDDFDPVERLGIPLLGEIKELRKLKAAEQADPDSRKLPTGPPPVPETTQELADFIAKWCAPHVARGADASLRAEVFLEDLDLTNPPLGERVVALARTPGVLDRWGVLCPAVAANREWHEEFIGEIRRLADGAEEEPGARSQAEELVQAEPDAEGRRGHADHDQGDDSPRQAGAQG